MSDEPIDPEKEIPDTAAAALPPVVDEVEKMPSQDSPDEEPPVDTGAPDPANDFETRSAVQECYYDEGGGRFWVRKEDDDWVDLNEGGLKRHLKKTLGLRDKPAPGKALSPLDEEVSHIEKNSRVAYAGALAGHKAGIHMIAGKRVLVPFSPELITPVKGDWSLIEQIFSGLLVG